LLRQLREKGEGLQGFLQRLNKRQRGNVFFSELKLRPPFRELLSFLACCEPEEGRWLTRCLGTCLGNEMTVRTCCARQLILDIQGILFDTG
jgi:hypothetical protein